MNEKYTYTEGTRDRKGTRSRYASFSDISYLSHHIEGAVYKPCQEVYLDPLLQ